MENSQVPIPSSFDVQPFVSHSYLTLSESEDPLARLEREPLVYDMLKAAGASIPYKPWEDQQEAVQAVLKVWSKLKHEQTENFRSKKGKADPKLMGKAFCICLGILYWVNGRYVPSLRVEELPEVMELQYKPVNSLERLQYIHRQPVQYHSFVQIVQLLEEIEKLHVKLMILSRNEKKEGAQR
ncbi:YpoC family protein [Metabacillus sp. 84]|uniref:YpoC family protein n=1 Tax=unclassified Metabacillus TaxID=2675274 RepID=UPI003CF88306